jgi:hypothetical protein
MVDFFLPDKFSDTVSLLYMYLQWYNVYRSINLWFHEMLNVLHCNKLWYILIFTYPSFMYLFVINLLISSQIHQTSLYLVLTTKDHVLKEFDDDDKNNDSFLVVL